MQAVGTWTGATEALIMPAARGPAPLNTSPQQKPGNAMTPFVLALDQGTTSSRAIVFDSQLAVRGRGQFEFTQHFPADGEVEHDPEEIWTTTLAAARAALEARTASTTPMSRTSTESPTPSPTAPICSRAPSS